MKSILISIRPEEVKKILNGEKLIETRKTAPKCELPCKVYIYCTNGYMLYDIRNEDYPEVERKCTLDYTRKSNKYLSGTPPMLNRKVVAYFTLNKIEKYIFGNKVRYVWYIEDLKVYDKPKELSEFGFLCKDYIPFYMNGCDEICGYYENGECKNGYIPLRKPPQSWCYVESLDQVKGENMVEKDGE